MVVIEVGDIEPVFEDDDDPVILGRDQARRHGRHRQAAEISRPVLDPMDHVCKTVHEIQPLSALIPQETLAPPEGEVANSIDLHGRNPRKISDEDNDVKLAAPGAVRRELLYLLGRVVPWLFAGIHRPCYSGSAVRPWLTMKLHIPALRPTSFAMSGEEDDAGRDPIGRWADSGRSPLRLAPYLSAGRCRGI